MKPSVSLIRLCDVCLHWWPACLENTGRQAATRYVVFLFTPQQCQAASPAHSSWWVETHGVCWSGHSGLHHGRQWRHRWSRELSDSAWQLRSTCHFGAAVSCRTALLNPSWRGMSFADV